MKIDEQYSDISYDDEHIPTDLSSFNSSFSQEFCVPTVATKDKNKPLKKIKPIPNTAGKPLNSPHNTPHKFSPSLHPFSIPYPHSSLNLLHSPPPAPKSSPSVW